MPNDPLIPDGLEPRPVPITFRTVDAFLPGLVMRRGVYENEDVSIVILATAHPEDEGELDTVVLGDLKFWAHGLDDAATRVPPEEPEEEQFDLADFTAEVIDDQRSPMRHFGIQVAAAAETAQNYVWLIDKAIAGHTIHWYVGGNKVSVSINHGTVKLRRSGYKTLDVPPTCENRPAPGGCSIKAFQDANYNIVGAGLLLRTTQF